jgi:multidrug efflux pump subunit AcrA (membrane-fusion protein)
MAEYTYQVGNPTLIKYECGKEKVVSYVNSSRYESETAVQTAERKIAEAKAVLAKAHEDLQKAKRNTRFGVEPSNGSILKFEKRYNNFGSLSSPYYFAAIRIGGQWYITSDANPTQRQMSWEELKSYIGDGKVWIPRNYDLMPSA